MSPHQASVAVRPGPSRLGYQHLWAVVARHRVRPPVPAGGPCSSPSTCHAAAELRGAHLVTGANDLGRPTHRSRRPDVQIIYPIGEWLWGLAAGRIGAVAAAGLPMGEARRWLVPRRYHCGACGIAMRDPRGRHSRLGAVVATCTGMADAQLAVAGTPTQRTLCSASEVPTTHLPASLGETGLALRPEVRRGQEHQGGQPWLGESTRSAEADGTGHGGLRPRRPVGAVEVRKRLETALAKRNRTATSCSCTC